MLKGYTLPRTPKGTSSLLPAPPWHFVRDALVVEFEADEQRAAAFLPEGLELNSGKCAVYFMDWQYASDHGEEYLDPVCSQYRETLFLLSACYQGSPIAYCPFIWVSQDKSMLRGLIQGWPKQFGETWITRDFRIPSKSGPVTGEPGKYGATLSLAGRRLVEARVSVTEPSASLPSPAFGGAALVRYFPELELSKQATPAVHELVRLKSRDVSISPVMKGEASLSIFDHPYTELFDLKPTRVNAGYRFTVATTIDDLELLKRY